MGVAPHECWLQFTARLVACFILHFQPSGPADASTYNVTRSPHARSSGLQVVFVDHQRVESEVVQNVRTQKVCSFQSVF